MNIGVLIIWSAMFGSITASAFLCVLRLQELTRTMAGIREELARLRKLVP